MNLIVAVNADWGIGCDGALMHDIPEDMAFFREKTGGKVVIMGRRTLESFPGGKPLKNRINVVLTGRGGDTRYPGALTCNSLDQLGHFLQMCHPDDVYVIGGQAVYTLLLPYCETAHVTKFTCAHPLCADCFFPDLDERPEWRLAEETACKTHGDFTYRFCTYHNTSVQDFGART